MKKNIILLAYTLMYCIHLFSQTTEVNYYSNNPNLGGDAVINRSMVSVKENSAIISFEVDVPTAGEYYANFWMFPTKLKDGSLANYAVSVNGSILKDKIVPTIGDWHDVTLPENRKISLNKGINTIAVIGVVPDIPSVEHVKISSSLENANIDATKYRNYKLSTVRTSVENAAKNALASTTLGADTLTAELLSGMTNSRTSENEAPLYDYEYALGLIIRYTFYKKLSFTEGEVVTISTSGINNFAHVLEFFRSTSPYTHSKSSMSDGNCIASLTDTIPETGDYYVRVRSYKNGHRGLCNLNINNVNYYDSIPVYSVGVRCKHEKNKRYNTFTSNSTSNPFMWIEEGVSAPGKIYLYNDNFFRYPGCFDWGVNARILRNYTRETHAVLLSCSNSSNPDGRCDLYMKCKSYSEILSFPNLSIQDGIPSSPRTYQYNCISWSGAITSTWTWPLDTLSSFYSPDSLTAFDNFYASRGLTRTGATANNGVVALWAIVDSLGNRNYTHASVRKGADNNLHGYDWESKAGANIRLFHPRHDLTGPVYGEIVEYYIRNNTSSVSLKTLEEEIADGTARIEYVNFTTDEKGYLQSNIQAINSSVMQEFNMLYDRWEEVAENSVCSNPKQISDCQEYRDVLTFCNSHRELLYMLYDKVGKGEFAATMLVADLTFSKNTVAIERVKESISISSTRSDIKTIRPLLSNYIAYIKELLALENEILAKGKRLVGGETGISYSNARDFEVTSSHINFSLNGSAQVSLLILDLSGRTITTIVNNESLDSGNHTYQMPSITDDVYLVQLIIDGHVNVKKVYNSTFASRIYGDKGR